MGHMSANNVATLKTFVKTAAAAATIYGHSIGQSVLASTTMFTTGGF